MVTCALSPSKPVKVASQDPVVEPPVIVYLAVLPWLDENVAVATFAPQLSLSPYEPVWSFCVTVTTAESLPHAWGPLLGQTVICAGSALTNGGGLGVGDCGGIGVGDAVGVGVGECVGLGDGVGECVGLGVGECVGLGDGVTGIGVGEAVGVGDGDDVGAGLGEEVGDCVGLGDGDGARADTVTAISALLWERSESVIEHRPFLSGVTFSLNVGPFPLCGVTEAVFLQVSFSSNSPL